MVTVTARCTQCAHTDFGDRDTNNNRVKYEVDPEEIEHGVGKQHGTEIFICPQCSGECDLDDCEIGNPCENCSTETIHNRCGASVPRGN